MEKQYHILNGDALKEQFPKELNGEIIVARECLVDGNVKGQNLDEFFTNRAKFISQNYGETVQDYYDNVVAEFHKIGDINGNAAINLWFEDDLFCQVNFWFVSHLLHHFVKDSHFFLVRPKVHTRFGFGGLSDTELIEIYNERLQITEIDKIADLWKSYQNDDTKNLLSTAHELKDTLPFILKAVKAHIDRIPTENNYGRPTQTLLDIIKELKTDEFGPVFKEFNKREYIYGFGDLQVKKLLDNIKNIQ